MFVLPTSNDLDMYGQSTLHALFSVILLILNGLHEKLGQIIGKKYPFGDLLVSCECKKLKNN